MEKKKPPTSGPVEGSRFAEVTRRAREERAKKPKQVPSEQRPNPYAIEAPNAPEPDERPKAG